MFPAFLMPMLIGAGTGALGGLLTGKDPFKGALLGGATGGLLSSIPAIGAAGATGGGAKVAMGDIASSTALPAALQGSSAATGLGGATSGAGINLSKFAAEAPMSFSYAPEVLGGANIGNLSQYATGAGTDLITKTPSMFDQISPYLNVRDLSGAAQVASQFQPRPLPTPQQGQVTQGRAPQGTDVMALLQSIKQPERRRITLL